jgi:hexokinase
MNRTQVAASFMRERGQTADCIDVSAALEILDKEISDGLEGRGGLPMRPAFISPGRANGMEYDCVVVDIGGTVLRVAEVHVFSDGSQELKNVRTRPVPGLEGGIDETAFFHEVAEFAEIRKARLPVAISFSHDMESIPGPDAKMLGWSKELNILNMTGATVAGVLRRALDMPELKIAVVNDSVAATLGCPAGVGSGSMGLIVGTGFNICCPFRTVEITKLEPGNYGESMIVNTEIGASRAFPKGEYDSKVILSSNDPELFHAEKQCSGRYLQEIIALALADAREHGLIQKDYTGLTLREMSGLVSIQNSDDGLAGAIVCEAEKRSAEIAAICTAALAKRMESQSLNVMTEGSVINRMPGYRSLYEKKLRELTGLQISLFSADNACLRGAARIIAEEN